jgi:hypothetical protein
MRPGPNHTKKAIPLLAAFSLVLHTLLLGAAASSMPGLRKAVSSTAIACPEHAGSHGQGDHGQKNRDHRICCILCGKIGPGFGPLPAAFSLAVPLPTVVTADFGQSHPDPQDAGSVLPVGARAPPLFG